jgi:hypothetical protein
MESSFSGLPSPAGGRLVNTIEGATDARVSPQPPRSTQIPIKKAQHAVGALMLFNRAAAPFRRRRFLDRVPMRIIALPVGT